MYIQISYSAWKTVVEANQLASYYLKVAPESRILYAGIPGKIYQTQVDQDVDFPDWYTNFELSGDWDTTEIFNKNDPAALISGIEPDKTTSVPLVKGMNGEAVVHAELPIGGGYRPTTHNFCDKCTWYQQSEHMDDVACTTADDLTYQIEDSENVVVQHVIDIRHRRLVDEDAIHNNTTTPAGVVMSDIVPTVRVDGTPLVGLEVEQGELAGAADPQSYYIDYDAGTIVFKTAQTGSSVSISCRICGRSPGNSSYEFRPVSGYEYVFEDAEVDYTGNFNMTSAMEVIVWISNNILTNAGFLASQGIPGMDLLSGTQIIPGKWLDPAENRFYKTFHDFQAKARKFMGPVPGGHGGPTRGAAADKWTFQWDYAFRDLLEPYDRPGIAAELQGDPMAMTLHNIQLVLEDDVPWESLDSDPAIFTMTFIGRKRKLM